MRLVVWGLFFCFSFLDTCFAAFIRVEGIEKVSLSRVCVSPLDDNLIYVTSPNILFKSEDNGKTWKKIFIVKDELIKDLYVDKFLYDTVYLASQSFLYRIVKDEVKKIFTSPTQTEINCIGKNQGIIYVGTNEGLFSSKEDSWLWKKLKGLPQDLIVYSLTFSSKNIYVGSNQGIYLSEDGKNFDRTFVLKREDIEEEEELIFVPRILKLDRFREEVIYLGTSKGLFISYDGGKTFSKRYIPIVENADIKCISYAKEDRQSLYLATNRGIFVINPEKNNQRSLFEGLPTKDICWLDFDGGGRLFAATSKGLFFQKEFTSSTYIKLEELFKKEPSFDEVQKAALHYNEVHPDKIKKWRNALKYRALFPRISLNYDKTVYGTHSGGGQFAVGPYDWGITFSWEIGDLIWNYYEDDVDTRSRLNTQLRNNILDDVNGIYFERLRIKLELMDSVLDDNEKIRKQLRLQELTATLDGYTGGFFTKRLKELRAQD